MKGPSNLIVTGFGRKGSGKTYLVKEMIPEFPRVVILDTNQEYGDVSGVVFTELTPALVYLIRVSRTSDPFVMSYVPEDVPGDGLDFLRVVAEVPRILVVVDEAHMYCKANMLPPAISRLVRLGRHKEISQVYIAQRPASVPRDITAQSDVVFSFQQHEGRDVAYMTNLYGRSAESLKTLGKYRVEVYGDRERAPLAVLKAEAKRNLTRQEELF